MDDCELKVKLAELCGYPLTEMGAVDDDDLQIVPNEDVEDGYLLVGSDTEEPWNPLCDLNQAILCVVRAMGRQGFYFDWTRHGAYAQLGFHFHDSRGGVHVRHYRNEPCLERTPRAICGAALEALEAYKKLEAADE